MPPPVMPPSVVPPPVSASPPGRPGDDRRTAALLARLWRGYLRPHAGAMSVALVLMVIEGGTLGALSRMLEPLFDRVFTGGQAGLIWGVGLGILGLFLVRAVTSVLSRMILTRIAQTTSTGMQTDLLAHILTLDAAFFQANPPGALIERVQGDTIAVQNVWSALISGLGRDLVSLLSLLAVALWIDPVWTAAAFVGAPLLILPTWLVQRYIRRTTAKMRHEAGLRATRLDEVFHGIAAVKLNRMEDYQVGRFRSIVGRIVRAEVATATSRAMIPALIDVVTGIGFFAVLILGGREIISGEKTIGEFMSFFTAMALTFQPLRKLGDMTGILQVAAASLDRVYRLFDTAPASGAPATPRRPAPGATGITLADVHLAYGNTAVLDGLSFTAEPGQTTALVGASGAGKSTVFALLTRLADAQSGSVRIGDVDLADIPLPDLRDLFSVVAQDAALFDETIRDNVLLGRGGVSDAALAAALDAAHVSAFTATLPQGADTPAGPRGSGLSGGQRQRVAIARAILRDAPILLLDEATSALDAASELAVQDALSRLSAGRTTLVIAHRLATIRGADKIVVMDRGRVVEQGRHTDLLDKGGFYAHLYRLQFQDT